MLNDVLTQEKMMGMYHGRLSGAIRVVTNPACTQEIKRTWKERLLTRPWKPFKKTKHMPAAYMLPELNLIFCHPQIRQHLEEQMDEYVLGNMSAGQIL